MNSQYDTNRFIIATFITYLGTGIQILGAAYVSFMASGSIFSIGGVFLAYAVPQVFVAYFVPGFLSRFGSHVICIWSDYLRAGLMMILGFLVYFDMWVLASTLLITVLASVLDCFFVPSSNSLFQRIVAESKGNAGRESSRLETAVQVAMLISVTFGALIASLLGAHIVFILNGLTFLFSGVIFQSIRRRKPESTSPDQKVSVVEHYSTTIKLYQQEVVNFSLARIVPNVMNTITTYFVIESLGKNILMLGLVDAIASIGFGIGAWLYPRLIVRHDSRSILTLSMAVTALLIYLQPLYGLATLSITFFFATLAFGVSRVAARALIIEHHGDEAAEAIYATANLFGIVVAIVLTLGVCVVEVMMGIKLAYALIATFLVMITVYLKTMQLKIDTAAKVIS